MCEDPKALPVLTSNPRHSLSHFPALDSRRSGVRTHDHDVLATVARREGHSRDQIHILVVIELEVHDAFVPKGGIEWPSRIQSDQPIAGRNVEDRSSVPSVQYQAAARKLPWSAAAASAPRSL